jgi:hypothetical protein
MRITLLALLTITSACGDDDTPGTPDAPPGTADAPPGAADAPPGAADAPPPPDASPPDAPPGPTNESIVIISEQVDSMGGADGTAAATFSPGPLFGGPTATGKIVFPIGALGEPIAAGAACGLYLEPSEAGVSAGVVTITGGTIDVTLNPVGAGTSVDYDTVPFSLPDDLFVPGAALSVSVSGTVDWPAWSASTTAPAPIEGATIPAALSRSTPPTVTYTAGTGDEMWIWALTVDIMAPMQTTLIWCRAPDNGTFTFPSTAWSLIPAGDTDGFVVLWRTNQDRVLTGNTDNLFTAATAIQGDFVPLMP